MAGFSLFQRTLKCALDIVGSEHRLAYRLRVPREELRRWLTGEESVPRWVFLVAVDVLVSPTEPAVPPEGRERRRKRREQLQSVE
jgi:hypothetical protein